MKEQLEKIRQEALDCLSKASDTNELDALRAGTDAPAPELCENTVSVDVAPWQIVTVKVRQKGEGIG